MHSRELHPEVKTAVAKYLHSADRLLPGAITDLAVGGSIALDAYRPGASDIDLVAVFDDSWKSSTTLQLRLRALHLSQVPFLFRRALRGLKASACCNTSFIWRSELSLPVSEITPIASHTGELFTAHRAFDVNPVIWKELQDGGISIRGREIEEWNIDPEPELLGTWSHKNLMYYWRPLMLKTRDGHGNLSSADVEWNVLGPARIHATIHTEEILSKEAAGFRAMELFPQHAPIIRVALAHLRSENLSTSPPRHQWRIHTATCMSNLID